MKKFFIFLNFLIISIYPFHSSADEMGRYDTEVKVGFTGVAPSNNSNDFEEINNIKEWDSSPQKRLPKTGGDNSVFIEYEGIFLILLTISFTYLKKIDKA